MFKRTIKISVVAVMAVLIFAAPTLAATTICDGFTKNYDGKLSAVEPGGTAPSGYVDCNVQLSGIDVNDASKKFDIYGASLSDCSQAGTLSANPEGLCATQDDLTKIIQRIITTIIFVIGIIAVVMIILGGINYAMSQGDPGKVKKAKDTILYGIIGLVVALMAFAIVNFVMNALN